MVNPRSSNHFTVCNIIDLVVFLSFQCIHTFCFFLSTHHSTAFTILFYCVSYRLFRIELWKQWNSFMMIHSITKEEWSHFYFTNAFGHGLACAPLDMPARVNGGNYSMACSPLACALDFLAKLSAVDCTSTNIYQSILLAHCMHCSKCPAKWLYAM